MATTEEDFVADKDDAVDERQLDAVGSVRDGGTRVPKPTSSYRTGERSIHFGNNYRPDAVYTDDDGRVWRIVTDDYYDHHTGRLDS